jgi:hypothetical protein
MVAINFQTRVLDVVGDPKIRPLERGEWREAPSNGPLQGWADGIHRKERDPTNFPPSASNGFHLSTEYENPFRLLPSACAENLPHYQCWS